MSDIESLAMAVMVVAGLVFLYRLLTARARYQRDIVNKSQDVIIEGIRAGIVKDLDDVQFAFFGSDSDAED